MSFVKRYWIEIIVFAIIFGILLNNNLPNFTWINTDSDGPHYILAAKHFLPAHNTSAPLFLLLSHMFLWIPYGTEAWRMGLISVLATVGTTIYIYLIVRHLLFDNPKSRWYALIASVVFGGSALVISQSTIIETYALSTMFIVGAYYYCLKRNWLLASVMIGLTWATHTLFAWMAWVVLLIMYREMRNVVLVFVTLLFLSFYAYIPIVVAVKDVPLMWGNTTFSGFIEGNLGTLLMLGGALSIWDLPKRILDTIGILGVSLGLGAIPLVWHFIKVRKWKYGLLWLFLIPILWFATNLAPETYVYMFPSIAFGSVAVALGLSKMRKEFAYAVMVVAVGLMGFNAHYFDIGQNLDSEMSAVKFYNEELPKIPDGEIFMGGGWTWAMVYFYNMEEGRDIVRASTDAMPEIHGVYVDMLKEQGIKAEMHYDQNFVTRQAKIMLSVVRLNEGVWIAKETKPEVYEYEIVPARGNEDYVGRWIDAETLPEWRWKPSNPYHFITGALEVAEWNLILQSSRNCLFFVTFGMFGYLFYWVGMSMLKNKRKAKKKEEISDALPKS